MIVKNDCERCGHSSDWHTLSSESEVQSPTDPQAKFHCLGMPPGTAVNLQCDCPDFVGEAITVKG